MGKLARLFRKLYFPSSKWQIVKTNVSLHNGCKELSGNRRSFYAVNESAVNPKSPSTSPHSIQKAFFSHDSDADHPRVLRVCNGSSVADSTESLPSVSLTPYGSQVSIPDRVCTTESVNIQAVCDDEDDEPCFEDGIRNVGPGRIPSEFDFCPILSGLVMQNSDSGFRDHFIDESRSLPSHRLPYNSIVPLLPITPDPAISDALLAATAGPTIPDRRRTSIHKILEQSSSFGYPDLMASESTNSSTTHSLGTRPQSLLVSSQLSMPIEENGDVHSGTMSITGRGERVMKTGAEVEKEISDMADNQDRSCLSYFPVLQGFYSAPKCQGPGSRHPLFLLRGTCKVNGEGCGKSDLSANGQERMTIDS